MQLASPRASVSLKQYCLLKALAANLKTVAISQNNLRPFEIQKPDYIRNLFPLSGDPAKREGVLAIFAPFAESEKNVNHLLHLYLII